MKNFSPALAIAARMPSWRAHSNQPRCQQATSAMKARQSAKIRELGEALVAAGVVTLDEQAQALGVGRSTAWTILKNSYKNSGISATIISRILSSPRLPSTVNARAIEYIDEKVAGLYGHGQRQRRRFVAMLTARLAERSQFEKVASLQPELQIEKNTVGGYQTYQLRQQGLDPRPALF